MDDLATLIERIRACCDVHVDGRIDRGTFLERCTRLVATDLGCARAGVWQFMVVPEHGQVLRCLAMYDLPSDRMVAVPDSHDVGAYFVALEQTGYVNACDASGHFATTGLLAERLSTRRIRSLLAATMSSGGTVRGAMTCTEVEQQVEWSLRQVNVLRRLAGLVAGSLFADRPGVPGLA